MEKLKKIFSWMGNNLKLVLLVAGAILLAIFVFSWGRKNKKVRELEQQVALLNAKIKLERLTIKYEVSMKELDELRKKDKAVSAAIEIIKKDLEEKLKPDMTAEEIAQKFRELGIK